MVDRPAGDAVLVQAPREVEALEQELDGGSDDRRFLGTVRDVVGAQPIDRDRQPGHLSHPGDVLARRGAVAGLDGEPILEGLDDALEIVDGDASREGRVESLGDEPLDDPFLGRFVAGRLELDLADGRGDDSAQIQTRGAPTGSPRRTARLRAAASSTSAFATETRTLTPDRWLISGERRARWVSSATSSSMKAGTTTAGVPSSTSNRCFSWRTIAISCSSVRG